MSIRLRFPRGSSFSFLRQFVKEGAAVDLSGATLAAYLKNSAQDADIDAIASLTISPVYPSSGIVRITINASATAALLLCPELFWQARATLASGYVVGPESLQGPVMLTPFLTLYSPEIMAELTPDIANDLTTMANNSLVGFRSDVIDAATHRAVVTNGQILPWVILTNESTGLYSWTLRAKGIGEADDGDTFRQPNDWNALTNNVIWVKSSIG